MRWTDAAIPALALLLAPATAGAQACPDTPPDFRPHVWAHLEADLVPLGSDVVGGALLVPVFCSYGPAPPAPPLAAMRFVVAQGPSGTAGTVLRPRGSVQRFRLRLPAPGTYEVRVESQRSPDLVPASLRFRVERSGRSVRLHLQASPLDRPRAARARLRAADGLATDWVDAPRRGGRFELRLPRVEPATYRVEANFDRTSRTSPPVIIPPDGDAAIDVSFPGSHVSIVTDGQPDDGRAYAVWLQAGDGTTMRAGLERFGADFGPDVPPGPAVLSLRTTPRLDPWDPEDRRHHWVELRRFDTVVPAAAEHRLRWSSARLFAGEDPRPISWWQLPGRAPSRSRSDGPRGGVLGFAIAGGRAHVVTPAALFEGRGPFERLALPRQVAPGRGAVVSVAVLRADAWAWIDGTNAVSFRTPLGIAREEFPTYAPGSPYPCVTTGIATDGRGRIVVSGRCRPNVPVDQRDAPADGYLAVRGDEDWRVVRGGWSPLGAIVWDGSRFVAVGDRGQLVVGQPDAWQARRVGEADLVGVVADARRVVARTDDGRLLEIGSGPAAVALAEIVDQGRRQPVAAHCLAGGRVVALLPAIEIPHESAGARDLPERLVVEQAGALRVIEHAERPRVQGLACDRGEAWALDATEPGRALRPRRLSL